MDRLDKISAYFAEKDRKKLDASTRENNKNGLPTMTREEIRLTCLENGGYDTPELNDKLYLHFRGFKRIENLERYTGCKALWLDSNGFEKIENLEPLVGLRCLFLSKNLITSISGLGTLQELTLLDLSNNRISRIENLSCCPKLQTLNISRNFLSTPESIEHFRECPLLNNIDITNNKLEADEAFMDLFPAIPSLVTLSVNGNEITKLPHFRKRLITAVPKLGYLDRPIEVQERLAAEAFVAGGADAEMAARTRWKEEQNAKRVKEMEDFRAWQVEQRKIREAERAEGRARILQFTPEEQQQREAEAQQAAEAERQLLNIGVEQIAKRYWAADGGSEHNDLLSIVSQQLLEEQRATAAAQAPDRELESIRNEDVVVELLDDNEHCQTEDQKKSVVVEDPAVEIEEEVPPPPTAQELAYQNELRQMQLELERIQEELRKQKEEEKRREDEEKALRRAEEDRRRRQEMEEQREREMRVADSLRIYKEQREAEKRAQEEKEQRWRNQTGPQIPHAAMGLLKCSTSSSDSGSTTKQYSSTWTMADLARDKRSNDQFFWSESMDIRLAQEVRSCAVDFRLVSQNMKTAALEGAFTGGFESGGWFCDDRVIVDADSFTEEVCRVRWSQLDAQQWSQADPAAANEVLHKVFYQTDEPGSGHGDQPSFMGLANQSKTRMPAYLKPPTAFPSVRETVGSNSNNNNGEDSDGDEEVVDTAALRSGTSLSVVIQPHQTPEDMEELD